MKHIALLICCTLFAVIAFAQNDKKSGVVSYEKVVKIELKIAGDNSQLAANLPKERRSKMILLFNDKASIYEVDKTKTTDETIEQSSGGAHFMIKMNEPDNKTFTDFTTKKILKQQEFMTRKFLIDATPDNSGWKITGNQKNILNILCTEAVKVKDSITTRVWFAPSIPVSSGPDLLGNCFPGLILEAELNNGKETITALSIKFEPVDDKKIMKPKDGKKVTQEEFKKIVDEKRKEMEEQGGGRIIIRTH